MNNLIDDYLKRGFGSMNKNDFEVAIFHNVMQDAGYCGLTDYDLSRKLRIPESKVKRLRYEAELKYGNPDYRAKFLEILKKAKFYEDGERVQFIVPDMSVRNYLNDIFIKKGIMSNTSYNTDILTISANDLIATLQDMFSTGEIDIIVKRAEEISNTKSLTFQDVLKNVISGIANGVTTWGISALLGMWR